MIVGSQAIIGLHKLPHNPPQYPMKLKVLFSIQISGSVKARDKMCLVGPANQFSWSSEVHLSSKHKAQC